MNASTKQPNPINTALTRHHPVSTHRHTACAVLLAVLSIMLPTQLLSAPADWFVPPQPRLTVGIGAAQIFDSKQELCWGLEYTSARQFYYLRPWILIGTGKNDEFYSAIGVQLDFKLPHNYVLTPSFGGGYYSAAEGLDLGYKIEFRTALTLAKQFKYGHRIGLSISHLSNGSLSDRNPGTESLMLHYSFPMDTLYNLFRKTTPPATLPAP